MTALPSHWARVPGTRLARLCADRHGNVERLPVRSDVSDIGVGPCYVYTFPVAGGFGEDSCAEESVPLTLVLVLLYSGPCLHILTRGRSQMPPT